MEKQIEKINTKQLLEACNSLVKIGEKYTIPKDANRPKTDTLVAFLEMLLEIPEERENDLEDIVFIVEASIRENLVTDSIRASLAVLKELKEPEVVHEPEVAEEVAPVETTPVQTVEVAPQPVVPPVETPPVKVRRRRRTVPKKERKEEGLLKINKVKLMTEFIWNHMDMSMEQVATAMFEEGIPCNLSTLGFEYRAVHRSYKVLLEKGLLSPQSGE